MGSASRSRVRWQVQLLSAHAQRWPAGRAPHRGGYHDHFGGWWPRVARVGRSAVGGLLERERELDALDELIGRAQQGAGSAVLIEGDAGIGKTALLTEASARAASAGMVVLSASRRATSNASSLGGWCDSCSMDAVSRAAGRRARVRCSQGAAALAPAGAGDRAGTESAVDAVYATLHGLYWLTVNLAQRDPLLLADRRRALGGSRPRCGSWLTCCRGSRSCRSSCFSPAGPRRRNRGPATELLARHGIRADR